MEREFHRYLENKWKSYIKEKKLRKCTEQIAKQGHGGYISRVTLDFEIPILRKGKKVLLSSKPK